MTSRNESDRLLTPQEVADRLHVTRQWVYILMRRGELGYIRLPSSRRVRITQGELDRFLASGQVRRRR